MANPMMRTRVREAGDEYGAEGDGAPPLAVLEGVLERITFHNTDNGYSVVKVQPDEGKSRAKADIVTVLGSFSNPIVGESLRCYGEWIKHPQYGSQFKLERYETLRPATSKAIEKYLGSGMIKGIGPVMAKRIVDKFGDAALDIIETETHKLIEVSGLGEKRVTMIRAAWEEQREIRNIMLFLQGHGVTPTFAVKIYRKYKDRSIEVVETNPFQLATDIWGIGFKSADKIAQNMGFAPDDPRRLEAGIVYVLNQEMDNGGHCFLPEDDLIRKASEILLPPTDPDGEEITNDEYARRLQAIRDVLGEQVTAEKLVAEPIERLGIVETAIYTPSIHATERAVADRLAAMVTFTKRERTTPAEAAEVVANLEGFDDLSPEQREAVKRSLSEPVLVLTGGPGTGKCVTGDSLVLATSGLTQIEKIWGQAGAKPDTFRPLNLCVQARNGLAPTSHAYYGGWRETIKITTNLGLEIEGTPNHRIWAMTEHGPDWVRLDALRESDFVAVRRGDDLWPAPATGMPGELAYLLGVIAGDGSLAPTKSLMITNNDRELLEKCNLLVEKHFGFRGRIISTRSTFELRVHSIELRRQLSAMGMPRCKSEGKVIPAAIMNASRDAVVHFLAGLIDTDGHIAVRAGGQVSFEITLKSEEMIRQMQLLLLNLGIVSRRAVKTVNYTYRDRIPEMRSYWRLSVLGEDVDRLMQVVPTRKAVPLRERLCNTNRDIVPLPGAIIRAIFTCAGARSRREWWAWKREIKGERLATRARLLSLLAERGERSNVETARVLEEACDLRIFWDKIVAKADGHAEVYDLTVPGEESFVANGFINHNTTTTRAIVTALEKMGRRLQLASPTGRAAKRASEVTGREAKTIHRLLAFDPETRGFKHGPDEPLDLDVLIIDEASMLDLVLTHSTLRAMPQGAQILFVGDVDQLPSVGPGNVLADLIASGRVPVARLTQVFRQAAQSRIITNAHAINQGRMPELLPPSAIKDGADCVFVEADDSDEIPGKIAGVVARSLRKLGYSPDEIMVLAPMQRGTVGGKNLNETLQQVLNPPRPDRAELTRGPIVFRVGDRVMQRVNNYDKNVYNGDVGTILEIERDDQILVVGYPEGPVEYDFVDVDQLAHALCVTIHKSQGSEYPACVIAVHTQHYMMLQRNLIYTALTRAKRLAVFVGSKRAIAMAVRNRNVVPRNTRLRERLQNLVGESAGSEKNPTTSRIPRKG